MCKARTICLVALASLLTACAPAEDDNTAKEQDSLGFPFDETQEGKQDVFGRSLVGVPRPYVPNADLLADPAAAEA